MRPSNQGGRHFGGMLNVREKLGLCFKSSVFKSHITSLSDWKLSPSRPLSLPLSHGYHCQQGPGIPPATRSIPQGEWVTYILWWTNTSASAQPCGHWRGSLRTTRVTQLWTILPQKSTAGSAALSPESPRWAEEHQKTGKNIYKLIKSCFSLICVILRKVTRLWFFFFLNSKSQKDSQG